MKALDTGQQGIGFYSVGSANLPQSSLSKEAALSHPLGKDLWDSGKLLSVWEALGSISATWGLTGEKNLQFNPQAID